MTVEEYILLRSTLPKDGTYTMLEHLQAMVEEFITVGEIHSLDMSVKNSFIKVDNITQSISVNNNIKTNINIKNVSNKITVSTKHVIVKVIK